MARSRARERTGGDAATTATRNVGVAELGLIVAAVVAVAIAPVFLLAKTIDGDEWLKGGAGIVGAVLTALGAIWRICVTSVSGGEGDGNSGGDGQEGSGSQ